MWARQPSDRDQNTPEHATLTRREREILRLMAEDLTNAEIAERLVVTPGTVKWYVKQIYSKLDVHTRDEAIAAMPKEADGDAAPDTSSDRETPHNLPALMTPLVGRQAVIRQLCTHLHDENVRLLTLIGTGGIGKTRLSLEVGMRMPRDYPSGVTVVGYQDDGFVYLLPDIALREVSRMQAVRFTTAAIGAQLREEGILIPGGSNLTVQKRVRGGRVRFWQLRADSLLETTETPETAT